MAISNSNELQPVMLSVDDLEGITEDIRVALNELNNMLELLEYLAKQADEFESPSAFRALGYMTGQIYTQFDVSYDSLHMMVKRLNDDRARATEGAS